MTFSWVSEIEGGAAVTGRRTAKLTKREEVGEAETERIENHLKGERKRKQRSCNWI
jgi:hypothetical protein